MYSDKSNVQIVISLLKQYGVRLAVISPGSRNLAIIKSLENDPFFQCYSVVDERSAAYFAIGLGLEKGEPVAISCTSGQATRNYIPGLTQAFYRGSQIVALTADWTPDRIGQGLMQTLEQLTMPSDTVKMAVNLPIVTDKQSRRFCERLVNVALLEMTQNRPGPVQINIPIEEHWDGATTKLLNARKINRYFAGEKVQGLLGKKILLVIGEHAPFTQEQTLLVHRFCEKFGAALYTNHLSNLPRLGLVTDRSMLTSLGRLQGRQYWPEIVISIGGQHGDYDLDAMLNRISFEHWQVRLDGHVLDTFGKLTKVFSMDEESFFADMLEIETNPIDVPQTKHNFRKKWESPAALPKFESELPLSGVSVARFLSPKIPDNSILHFGILSSLRIWQFFPLSNGVVSFSNVATFGIDGSLSTFLGHSHASRELAFMVIGDLSFFYDMNVVGVRSLPTNVRIVVINNGGGGEFRQSMHAAQRNFGKMSDPFVAAAGHFGSVSSWVKSMGLEYRSVTKTDELEDATSWLVSELGKPAVLEIFTIMEDDSLAFDILTGSNTRESLEKKVARTLPSPAVSKLKALSKK